MNEHWIEIGKRIRNMRIQRQMMAKDLASSLGVARSAVCGWEKGNRQPDQPNLIKLAKFFNVSIDYILTGENVVKKKVPKVQGYEQLNIEVLQKADCNNQISDETVRQFIEFLKFKDMLKDK